MAKQQDSALIVDLHTTFPNYLDFQHKSKINLDLPIKLTASPVSLKINVLCHPQMTQ